VEALPPQLNPVALSSGCRRRGCNPALEGLWGFETIACSLRHFDSESLCFKSEPTHVSEMTRVVAA